MYDIIIIGGGVSGCAIAREISKYEGKFLLIEKESDVCCGTSKANSAIIHAGFDAAEGTLMAKLNVRGNELIKQLVSDLDIHYIENGALVVCVSEEDRPSLKNLYDRGIKNGVKGLRIVERDELVKMEPNISDNAICALYAPSSGIICPFSLTYAFAENACENGVEFIFNEEVININKEEDKFVVIVKAINDNIEKKYESKVVVNAAGLFADEIHNMVSSKKMKITPRKGEYVLLDREVGDYVHKTIFALPSKMGKGVLVSPTVHGNIIVGPTATDINDKDGKNTTIEGLEEVMTKCMVTLKNVPIKKVITSFAGLRAHESNHEFIIEESSEVKGFVDCAAIESPGLSSSPAIGEMVANICNNILNMNKKKNFVNKRKGIVQINKLPLDVANKLIKENPLYGNIVCRCQKITEGEIVDSIHRPLGATTLDGIKRRTTAGMGRCQAGFCTPYTMEILSRELNKSKKEITKDNKSSPICCGNIKENL
ncbi:MAG: NAD(P)/FAD-dependent oxidoreductase [Eubacteriales bacterium]|nr:NAD(P)/FAD-dependent oxidoreductase [Eubacteriales bacterium]